MFLSKRNGIYYVWYVDDAGCKKKVSTRSGRMSEALSFLQTFKNGKAPQKYPRIALSEFQAQLLSYVRTNYAATTLPIYRRSLNHLATIAGDIPLSFLSPLHFHRYKTHRLKTVSPVMVNIELRTLKAAMNTAARWRLLDRSPFERLSLASVPEQIPLHFTREDFQKLVSVIKERWIKEVLIFAALTGMRQGEILSLRWGQVDLSRRTVTVQSNATFRTKHGKTRIVPLNNALVTMLSAKQPESADEFVFTHNNKPIYRNFLIRKLKRYVRMLGLDDRLHFHSLRHTFATWLVQDGVSLYEVQKLLGHSSIAVTQVYSHLQPEQLHATVNRIVVSLN